MLHERATHKTPQHCLQHKWRKPNNIYTNTSTAAISAQNLGLKPTEPPSLSMLIHNETVPRFTRKIRKRATPISCRWPSAFFASVRHSYIARTRSHKTRPSHSHPKSSERGRCHAWGLGTTGSDEVVSFGFIFSSDSLCDDYF